MSYFIQNNETETSERHHISTVPFQSQPLSTTLHIIHRQSKPEEDLIHLSCDEPLANTHDYHDMPEMDFHCM